MVEFCANKASLRQSGDEIQRLTLAVEELDLPNNLACSNRMGSGSGYTTGLT